MSPDPSTKRITRLAPSPTGALHLGNARTFLVNWLLARQHDWSVVLRIEDLDGPRIKTGADRESIDLLEWLGLGWDVGPTHQSHEMERYRTAMRTLAREARAYPSELSRGEIEGAASAPHGGGELRAGPEHRPPIEPRDFPDDAGGWRFVTPDRFVEFDDRLLGAQCVHPMREVGDFVIWTRSGVPAYQLAVVVDDDRQGVTEIVRGEDLVPSTGRQQLLRDALGWTGSPRHTHLPLVVGLDGRKLSKRHGDTRLSHYRRSGVPVGRVLGLLGRWCGLDPERRRMFDLEELLGRFDLSRIPLGKIVLTPEDDQWLMEGARRSG